MRYSSDVVEAKGAQEACVIWQKGGVQVNDVMDGRGGLTSSFSSQSCRLGQASSSHKDLSVIAAAAGTSMRHGWEWNL